MPYKPNIAKEEWLDRCGVTAGLPLFESVKTPPQSSPLIKGEDIGGVRIPDWIWTGSGIKAEVYNKMKDKFAEDSLLYLRAIIQLGGKATDHEVKDFFNDPDKWTVAIISARRNYFTGDPFYVIKSFPNYKKMGPKKVPNVIWCVDFTRLYSLMSEEVI